MKKKCLSTFIDLVLFSLRSILSRDGVLYVKLRAGQLPYKDDPQGWKSLLASTVNHRNSGVRAFKVNEWRMDCHIYPSLNRTVYFVKLIKSSLLLRAYPGKSLSHLGGRRLPHLETNDRIELNWMDPVPSGSWPVCQAVTAGPACSCEADRLLLVPWWPQCNMSIHQLVLEGSMGTKHIIYSPVSVFFPEASIFPIFSSLLDLFSHLLLICASPWMHVCIHFCIL